MKINSLDRTNIQALRADLDLALKQVAARYGIVLKTGRCRFSPKAATMNLEIATVTNDGEVINPERATLLQSLAYLNLGESPLEKIFRIGNKSFKLAGYKRARYRKPFGLTCIEDGKNYVADEATVRRAMATARIA